MNKRKFDALTLIVKEMGITPQEVVHYWSKTGELSHGHQVATRPDDIRNKLKLYWYVFEGGLFSSEPDAYKNCIGVVGWINPNKNAPQGNRVYIVRPKQVKCAFSNCITDAVALDAHNGKDNTNALLASATAKKMNYPAVKYCNEKFKLAENENSFLPSQEQAILLSRNSFGIRNALAKIGGTFEGCIWTSTETMRGYTTTVHTQYGHSDSKSQLCNYNVTAIIAL